MVSTVVRHTTIHTLKVALSNKVIYIQNHIPESCDIFLAYENSLSIPLTPLPDSHDYVLLFITI